MSRFLAINIEGKIGQLTVRRTSSFNKNVISTLVRTTRIWNNIHQVRPITKQLARQIILKEQVNQKAETGQRKSDNVIYV